MLNTFIKFKNFFNPLVPYSIFYNCRLLILLSFFLALKIILKFCSIYVPVINLRLSFEIIPVLLVGWFFGPMIGIFFGIIADFSGFLFNGNIWYWQYAIQEPIMAFIAGLLGVFYIRFKYSSKLNLLIIHQVLQFIFHALLIFLLFYFAKPFKSLMANQKNSNDIMHFFSSFYYYWFFFAVVLFYIFIQIATFYFWKKDFEYFKIFFFVAILVFIINFFFSLFLGPIVTQNYLQYLKIAKSGYLIYLFPRLIKSILNMPFFLFLLTYIIVIIKPMFNNVMNLLKNSYHN